MKQSRAVQPSLDFAITRHAQKHYSYHNPRRSPARRILEVCALVAAISALGGACTLEHDTSEAGSTSPDVGGVRIALVSQTQDGHRYSLRNAVFTITAPDGIKTTLDGNSGDVVQAQLAAGSYTVELSGNYSLEESLPDMSVVPVAATLQSPATLPFDVVPPNMTDVAFAFVIGSMDVQFSLGGVNIGFTVANCNSGDIRRVACGAGGMRTDTCTNGDWQEGTGCFVDLGDGECRQQDGSYALTFYTTYDDLTPYTVASNAQQAELRCKATCVQQRAWCLAAQVGYNPGWTVPECSLITDLATFQASGQTLQDNVWGGNQVIDGVTYRTYCGGNGDCTHTNWAGGSLGPRAGWRCFVLQP